MKLVIVEQSLVLGFASAQAKIEFIDMLDPFGLQWEETDLKVLSVAEVRAAGSKLLAKVAGKEVKDPVDEGAT